MDKEYNIKELVQNVLDKGYLMSLATVDDGGVWVSDVIFVFDENFNIYWISSPEARHSRALSKNSRVAGTITISNQGENNLGIQFDGIAEKLDGAQLGLAAKHFKKRSKSIPETVSDVMKFLEGDSWYALRPEKMELICEELFGFEKQKINLEK